MRAAASLPLLAAAIVAVFAAATFVPRDALAFEDFEGTRALAMGGATRAWALGDSALLLNPSGMSLAKSYDVEASYAYGGRLAEHFIHASVVDSTSAAGLAGGLYYTYHHEAPGAAALTGHSHEAGAALALPLGNFVSVGGTLKWFRLEGSDDANPAVPVAGAPASTPTATFLTFDLGLTARPMPTISFAVVGANLVDHGQGQAPRTLSYGGAYFPIPEVVIDVDGVTTFTDDSVNHAHGTGVRGGLEVSIAQRVALRAGGGTDPVLGVGYLAAGVTAMSEAGAIDVGVRGDLFPYRAGVGRAVFLGVSLRLFVPGAVASAAAGAQSP